MSLYLDDGDVRLYHGDALAVLRELPDASVDCIATSPPFFGLRDYGTGRWEGGDEGCDHREARRSEKRATRKFTDGSGREGNNLTSWTYRDETTKSADCPKGCGATRVDQQIGLEATPDEWAARLTEVFREARRVLADHGTLWIECGDSYGANVASGTPTTSTKDAPNGWTGRQATPIKHPYKQKDLIGSPFLLAFALRADGWYWRGVNIWAKPNPLPESVRDRTTVAHSYVLQFAKRGAPHYWLHPFDRRLVATKPPPDYWWFPPGVESEPSHEPVDGWTRRNVWEGRAYYFDQEAVREPFGENTHSRGKGIGVKAEVVQEGGTLEAGRNNADFQRGTHANLAALSRPPQAETLDDSLPPEAPRGADGRRKTVHDHAVNGSHDNHKGIGDGRERWPNSGRNLRSVWTIPTEAFPEAHFATWPQKLAEQILKAACPEQVCRVCGKPRERITDVSYEKSPVHGAGSVVGRHEESGQNNYDGAGMPRVSKVTQTLGFTDCGHDSYRPGVVMDVFGGSGTTALVARRLGRSAVLIELNEDYCAMAARRLSQLSLLATEPA